MVDWATLCGLYLCLIFPFHICLGRSSKSFMMFPTNSLKIWFLAGSTPCLGHREATIWETWYWKITFSLEETMKYCITGIALFPYFLISLSPCFSIFVFVVKTNRVIVFSIQLNTYYSSGFLVPHPLPPWNKDNRLPQWWKSRRTAGIQPHDISGNNTKK